MLKYWENYQISPKSLGYVRNEQLYSGPPSVNGTPGIHHVMGRAIKDLFADIKPSKENMWV